MNTTIKSPRCHHLRFFRLAVGERFEINLVPYKKAGAFSARHSITGALRRVMPWDKVRSRRPVKEPECCGQAIERSPAYRGILAGNMGCQGDDAHDSAIMAAHAAKLTCGIGGDRTPESIGGNEKTPSA